MDQQRVARLKAEFQQHNSHWQSSGRQLQEACTRGDSDYRIEQHFREMESIYKRMYLCLDQMDSEYDSEGVQYSTGPFKDILDRHQSWLQSAAQEAGIESQI